MKSLKIITYTFSLAVTLPIRIYLFYMILKMINTTELMWFLFWVYVPFTVLISILMKIVDEEKKSKN